MTSRIQATNTSARATTMTQKPTVLIVSLLLLSLVSRTTAFSLPPTSVNGGSGSWGLQQNQPTRRKFQLRQQYSASQLAAASRQKRTELIARNRPPKVNKEDPWEFAASQVFNVEDDPSKLQDFVQLVTILRIGVPSVAVATVFKEAYPSVALWMASIINDSGAFAVISQDSSQFIQNILTTSGLVFSLLVGQTYYFMYQQQEAIYLALYEEVTVAKSLLEQVGLVSQGRESLYQRILQCIDIYVRDDLQKFNNVEPAVLLSARPVDDPLEDIMYLTSVGEPSIVYSTVKSLRQARAYRLGALQKKLPELHMYLLWSLATIVLWTFPLLGAGAQTIGGTGILTVQSWYLSFIVFGICLTMGVIYELRRPGECGAYNAQTVLTVMVAGLEEELKQRLSGDMMESDFGPTLDINRPASGPAGSNINKAAFLPLGTAKEVLSSKTKKSANVVVDAQSTADDDSNDSKRRRLRDRLLNWGSSSATDSK